MEISEAEWTRINSELNEARERLAVLETRPPDHSHPELTERLDHAETRIQEIPWESFQTAASLAESAAESVTEEVQETLAAAVEQIEATTATHQAEVIRDREEEDRQEAASPERRRLRII